MHPSFNEVDETDTLLTEIIDGKVIGLRFAKSSKPEKSEFFPSLDAAKGRIEELLLDTSTDGFWVGCVNSIEGDLKNLLLKINQRRAFSPMSTTRGHVIVYDLL